MSNENEIQSVNDASKNKKNKSDNSIILFKVFDTNLIKCSNVPKTIHNGPKFVYINYNDGPVFIQTPEMSIPYDIKPDFKKIGVDKDGKPTYDFSVIEKVNLNLSFKNRENDKNINMFYNKIEELDDKIIEIAHKNSLSWFKIKEKDVDINNKSNLIYHQYKTFLHHSKDKDGIPDGKYPSTLRVKIPYVDGKFEVESYDENKNEYDFNKILNEKISVKGGTAKCIIQLTGIIITPGSFSIMAKLKQIFFKIKPVINGFCFIDDDDDEIDNENNHVQKDMKQKKIEFQKVESSDDELDVPINNISINNNDDDDDDDEDDEPEPEPEPATTKKKIVKKK